MEVITGRNPVEYSRPAEEVRFGIFFIIVNLTVIFYFVRI